MNKKILKCKNKKRKRCLGGVVGGVGVEGDHEALAADVEEALGVLLLELGQALLRGKHINKDTKKEGKDNKILKEERKKGTTR